MKSLILKTILFFKITNTIAAPIPQGYRHCANPGGICHCNSIVRVGLPEKNVWYSEPIKSHGYFECTISVGKCWCKDELIDIAPGLKLLKQFNTTLFNSLQSYNILYVDTTIRKLAISYSEHKLMTTPELANSIEGIAAINGGFHAYGTNVGTITKLRVNNIEIVSNNTVTEWNLTDEDIEGVLSIDSNGHVNISSSDDIDTWSDKPTFLHSGPILLLNDIAQPFENNNWNYVRNPRTGVCIMDDDNIKLVTVDGRFYTSSGMTLPEFQTFLTMIGCKSAINLDGGGSTTMYVYKLGVINEPRDKPPPGVVGYNNFVTLRKISNAIVVL